MRLDGIAKIIVLILMIPSSLSQAEDGNGEDMSSFLPQDISSYSILSYEGLDLKVRDSVLDDIDFLKLNEGIADESKNYNVIIDGSGTGLKPPTNEEWNKTGNSIRIIDDISFSNPMVLSTSKLHNQSIYFPPIGNQGAEGSCASWAIGYYVKTFQEAKEHDWNLSGATFGGSWPGYPSSSYQDKIMSPDFLYHQINDGVNSGTYQRDNIFLAQEIGICTWEKMPYDCYNYSASPSEDAFREAPLYRSQANSTYMMYTKTCIKSWISRK